jgi:response regulator RpfG family c-di-GMP phosphodiesterase
MNKRVLFVDDEPNVLQSIRRNLRGKFDVDIAEGGHAALAKLRGDDCYAVLVSDMRMPGMNGVELLAQARQEAPDTVRLMLTGNADQQTAVEAVNQGDIFRFLNKPCTTDELASSVAAAIRQHDLITAEKELLENTVRGSIKALADILAITSPQIFGRTTRLKNSMTRLAANMGETDQWKYQSIAMLSQIGCVSVQEDLVRRRIAGHPLSREDLAEFTAHANVGADLVGAIPRLEDIAESIRYQEKNYDGSGYPGDSVSGDAIPVGARMMKIVLDFDTLQSSGKSAADAIGRMQSQSSWYDPELLRSFVASLARKSTMSRAAVRIEDLTDSMILAEDLKTSTDVLLVAKGQEMSLSVRRHLQNFLARQLIPDKLQVWQEDK